MYIRLAADADIPALNHLYEERRALLLHGGWRIPRAAPAWLTRDASSVWVGEADGGVVGYISVLRRAEGWVIDQMALDAHEYHPGLARALVGVVREAARADGVAMLLVRVPSAHPVEQAFWRALGATPVGDGASPHYQWMQLSV